MAKRMSEEEKQVIRDAYTRLGSEDAVANELDVPAATVRRVCKDLVGDYRKSDSELKFKRHVNPPGYDTHHSQWRRTNDPKHAEYKNYGGRGIEMYPAWQKGTLQEKRGSGYHNWYAYIDTLPKPNDLTTDELLASPLWNIDRIDSDGNYEPGNIQWLSAQRNAKKAAERRVNLVDA